MGSALGGGFGPYLGSLFYATSSQGIDYAIPIGERKDIDLYEMGADFVTGCFLGKMGKMLKVPSSASTKKFSPQLIKLIQSKKFQRAVPLIVIIKGEFMDVWTRPNVQGPSDAGIDTISPRR